MSAPIDSALRTVSVAASGPMHSTVTSPPCASWSFSASSTAYSSISFITGSVAARSSVESDASSFFSDQVSGTCFTQTTMFMRLPISYRDGNLRSPCQPAARPVLRRVRSGGYVTRQ